MNYSLKLLLVLAVFTLSGCASMLPYGDTYDCPQMEKGQCVSVEAAHDYAITGHYPGTVAGAPSPANDAALAEAIENYKKAVLKGKTEEIDRRQKGLMQIVTPGQASEFSEALEEYKKAIKSSEKKKIAEAEEKLYDIHARAVAAARDSARLEHSISSEATRQEYLGRYAQGQKTEAVLMPPVVMEVYILPYQTEFNTLAGERTMWVTVEPARWTWPDKFSGGKGTQIGSSTRGK